MADIRPFRAYRPAQGYENRIAALPYDVYNTEESRKIVEAEPLSFLSIDRAETQFPEGTSPYEEKVYEMAHDLLWKRADEGLFVQEETPCYYIYEQSVEGRTQTGIVGCASVDEYLNGTIKKHENTRADKEADRIHHVDSCGAQTGPIFLAYRKNEALSAIVSRIKESKPLYDFVSTGDVRNRVWIISDESDIDAVRSGFNAVSGVYIADGHHRCASAVKVGLKRRTENPGYTGEEEFNYFLSVLFPEDELKILDYNRVLKDLGGMTEEQLLEELSKLFTVTPNGTEAVHPQKKAQYGLYLNQKWYCLDLKPEYLNEDPVDGLDVALLQNLVLEPLFGISDPKSDPRIDFVGGIRGLGELERRVSLDCKAAFSMYATSIQELFAVADAGRLMPPKSTWFEPKLLSGLFIHRI